MKRRPLSVVEVNASTYLVVQWEDKLGAWLSVHTRRGKKSFRHAYELNVPTDSLRELANALRAPSGGASLSVGGRQVIVLWRPHRGTVLATLNENAIECTCILDRAARFAVVRGLEHARAEALDETLLDEAGL